MRHWTHGEYFNTIVLLPGRTSTFIHEAGHGLGAHHDRYTPIIGGTLSSMDDREGYNYGYCLPGNKYATIMSYPSSCPGDDVEWISYFSNPNVNFEGTPTGDSLNNNRAIRERMECCCAQEVEGCWVKSSSSNHSLIEFTITYIISQILDKPPRLSCQSQPK